MIIAKRPKNFNGSWTILGRLRSDYIKIYHKAKHYDHPLCFLWVNNFPLFAPSENYAIDGSLTSMHHPFTAPVQNDVELLQRDPLKVKGQHYDLVLNGVELGGGSIRIHDSEFQRKILKDSMKLSEQNVSRFNHLIDALGSGCPPHGGFAIGLDRLLTFLLKCSSIKDVIAFPKTHSGSDLCVGSPTLIPR